MAEVPLGTGIHYFADPTKGKPVYFGSVYVGEPDLNPKILANRVSVILLQEDGTKVVLAPSAQPFVTGAGGQILYQGSVSVINVTDSVSVRVDNQAGYQVNYNPRYNEANSITASLNEGATPINGSFEIENGAGIPANWAISVVTGSITVDTTESSHGLKSLKFNGIDATGAGTATSDKFNVQEGSDSDIRFSYRSTSATTLNEVSVRYFDSAGAPVSVDTVHSDGATNPAFYTNYLYRSIAPANAVQADIFIDGVKSAGTTTTGSTYFDGVFVDYNTENAVVETVGVVNGVNNITATDATTGNKPQINQTGADNVGIDIEGVELLNSAISTTGDINTTGDTSAATAVYDAVQADAITAKTVNSDIAISRNGTGGVTIDGTPVYGLVVLNTPVLIASDISITATANTPVDISAQTTGTAVKAIVKAVITGTFGGTVGTTEVLIGEGGETLLTMVHSAALSGGSSAPMAAVNNLDVNLASGQIFDYEILQTGTAPSDRTVEIYLIGYYI